MTPHVLQSAPHALRALSSALLAAAVVLVAGCADRAADRLTLRRVVLYRNGIGYFERSGTHQGAKLRLRVREHELNDVLRTMAVLDRSPGGPSGTISVSVAERASEKGAAHPKLWSRLDIDLGPARTRELLVSYAAPTPVWKATYRLVLPAGGETKEKGAVLQAWAMISNLSGEAWRDVQLELITGAPLSYAIDLRTPEFAPRPDLSGRLVSAVAAGPVTAERASSGDADGDGIPDRDDLCPNEPEDRDGFEDQDGCPDPDNDQDRIPDKDDKCPNEPENYNGFEDDDGCPDKGQVVIQKGRIEILDQIYFGTNKVEIRPVNKPILEAIAATLNGNPQIAEVEIQGHADAGEAQAWALSGERAGAVRAVLLSLGVKAALRATGWGDTRPISRETSADGRSRNRRVEFHVLKRRDESPAGPVTTVAAEKSTRALASPRDVAGSVRYQLASPISVASGASVQVALASQRVPCEDILLFKEEANLPGSDRHPQRAVYLKNESPLTLVPGPIAIFARGTFAGDGLIDQLFPGETAFIPYALDGSTSIRVETAEANEPARLVSLVDGVVTVEDFRVHTTVYEIRPGASPPARLYVRQARRPRHTPVGLPPRTEISADAYLMPIPIAASRTSVLRVREQAPVRAEIRILDDEGAGRLALYLRGTSLPPATEAKVREIMTARQKLGQLAEELTRLRARLGDVAVRAGEIRQTLRAIEKTGKAEAGLRQGILRRLREGLEESDRASRRLAIATAEHDETREKLREALKGLRIEGRPAKP